VTIAAETVQQFTRLLPILGECHRHAQGKDQNKKWSVHHGEFFFGEYFQCVIRLLDLQGE
jgi:hypothetical protein